MPDPAAVLTPDRGSEGSLSRLVEVLLDKGVVLDLDLVVTVAEVPLIAVNLRALVAGVETMVEYGVPGPWDPAVAAAVRRNAATPVARPEEAVAARAPASFGEHRRGGIVWRPGELVLDAGGTLRWQGDGDRRPALLADAADVVAIERVAADGTGGRSALRMRTRWREVQLAVDDADGWLALLGGRSSEHRSSGRDEVEG